MNRWPVDFLVAVLLTAITAIGRLFHVARGLGDFSHLVIGWLCWIWLVDDRPTYLWLALLLTVVEVVVFLSWR